MELVPAMVLGIEAVMPDGTIEAKSTAVLPDTTQGELDALERMLMQGVKHDFPDATEYRSLGWTETLVLDQTTDES